VGLFVPLGNPFATPEYLRAIAVGAERRGFHSLWVSEHTVFFENYDSYYPYGVNGKYSADAESGVLEPFAALSFFAACTQRIRLGTGMCVVPQRNPVYTAKSAAAIDWLSNGRFDFGIGVGWLAEEFSALAVPFEHRGQRCRDYVGVMRSLWCDAVSEYHGQFYDLPPCWHNPKPVQKPHPPIHFGGESDAALRRVADLGDGWYAANLAPEEVPAHISRLQGFLELKNRSLSEVQITVNPSRRQMQEGDLERYRAAGVDQLILTSRVRNIDEMERTLDSLAEQYVLAAERL